MYHGWMYHVSGLKTLNTANNISMCLDVFTVPGRLELEPGTLKEVLSPQEGREDWTMDMAQNPAKQSRIVNST